MQNATAAANSFCFYCVVIGTQLFVQMAFGSYGVILKVFAQAAEINPLIFSMLRDILATPVLLLAAFFIEPNYSVVSIESASEDENVRRKCVRVPKSGELLLFALLGLTGMFGNQLLFIQGVYFTNPSIASMFQPLIPILVALLASLTCTDPFPSLKNVWLIRLLSELIIIKRIRFPPGCVGWAS